MIFMHLKYVHCKEIGVWVVQLVGCNIGSAYFYGVPRGSKAPIRVDPYFRNAGRPVSVLLTLLVHHILHIKKIFLLFSVIGPFHFQAIIHKDGRIMFLYKQVKYKKNTIYQK